uniref:CSON013454 protein n=1 Tax=Culicoides sonorensis TaxID=179676 RepID=A0A336KMN7_CULSO
MEKMEQFIFYSKINGCNPQQNNNKTTNKMMTMMAQITKKEHEMEMGKQKKNDGLKLIFSFDQDKD